MPLKGRASCFVYCDGEQTRDFVYVKDVVKANILASHSAPGVYNIASGKSTSLNTLVATIANIMGVEACPRYATARPGDIRHSLANISRARSLGYSPDYSLEDALRETISWFGK